VPQSEVNGYTKQKHTGNLVRWAKGPVEVSVWKEDNVGWAAEVRDDRYRPTEYETIARNVKKERAIERAEDWMHVHPEGLPARGDIVNEYFGV
jgi:hypothetical protein